MRLSSSLTKAWYSALKSPDSFVRRSGTFPRVSHKRGCSRPANGDPAGGVYADAADATHNRITAEIEVAHTRITLTSKLFSGPARRRTPRRPVTRGSRVAPADGNGRDCQKWPSDARSDGCG